MEKGCGVADGHGRSGERGPAGRQPNTTPLFHDCAPVRVGLPPTGDGRGEVSACRSIRTQPMKTDRGRGEDVLPPQLRLR